MEQYIEQLKPLFEKVAEKIGQGAQFGWEVVVRQQITYGIIGVFFALLGLFLLVMGYRNRNIDWSFYGSEGKKVLVVCSFIFGGISFLAGSINAILYLSNPSYYALRFFIGLVK